MRRFSELHRWGPFGRAAGLGLSAIIAAAPGCASSNAGEAAEGEAVALASVDPVETERSASRSSASPAKQAEEKQRAPATESPASPLHEALECPFCDEALAKYDGPLSEDEARGLLLALNDEYHAWAVYEQVIADHGEVRPFSNIIRSEARHIAALGNLFKTYGLDVPENPWVRNVPRFDSIRSAAQAGLDAEVANVELYDRIFASTERTDILRVYEALQWASQERHLRAFRRWAGDQPGAGRGAGQGGRGMGHGRGRGPGPGGGRGRGQGRTGG